MSKQATHATAKAPMGDLAEVVLDNPILVKHLRSRLRPGQALPWAAIVLVAGACFAWAGHYLNWIGNSAAVMILVGMQVLILAFGGSNQLNASLGGARESGILDFHRVSPLPPAVVALGFFLGAPIREYALAAITLPFALFSAYHLDAFDPWRGIRWLAQLEVALLLTTWVVHAIAMIGCLTRKKPRGSIQGTVVTIILLIIFGSYGSVGFYFGAQWLLAEERTLNFFGGMIPWLAWLLIYELPVIGFLGLAVSRKMRAERTHAYTKAQALAGMATLTVLVFGGLWDVARLLPAVPPFEPTPADVIILAAVYVLSIAAMILSVTITPVSGEYIKGVRRAGHEGRRRPSPWSDAGSNRVALFILCGIALAGASAVINVVGRQPLIDPGNFNLNNPRIAPTLADGAKLSDAAWLESRQALMSRPIVIGVLTAAYVGLGLQYFSLRTRRSGLVLMSLFLFVAWLGPPLAAAAIGLSGPPREELSLTILALSPLPGIALSSGLGNPPGADSIQLAALAPPITFVFLFKYLLVSVQRKIDHRLHADEKATAAKIPVEAWESA